MIKIICARDFDTRSALRHIYHNIDDNITIAKCGTQVYNADLLELREYRYSSIRVCLNCLKTVLQ